MTTNHVNCRSVSIILRVLSPAIVIYAAYFVIRVMSIQPITEAGMGDYITSVFFLAGASVVYFVYVLQSLEKIPSSPPGPIWWLTSCYFLMLLAFDEIFAVHEWICYWLEIRDIWVFSLYGSILILLVYVIRRKLDLLNLAMFAAFVLFAGIAVAADTLTGEGMITIFHRAIDYEQVAETLAAFSLGAAFISIAVRELPIITSRVRA